MGVILFKCFFNSLFYFLISFITIFLSIFLIKIINGHTLCNILYSKEIIFSFLATISTFLIGMYHTINNSSIKMLLWILIILAIGLFVVGFNGQEIKDMEMVVKTTYGLLLISLILTIYLKIDYSQIKDDLTMQKKANKSREKNETILLDGKKLNILGKDNE